MPILDIGGDVGALMLYTPAERCDQEIDVSPVDHPQQRTHTQIHEWHLGGQTLYMGLYPELPAGEYHVWGEPNTPTDRVSILGGDVATLDWRGSRAGSQ